MDNFDFVSPTYIAFGKDKEYEVGKLIKKYGGSKVLIVYGGGSVIKSGLLPAVQATLNKENIPYVEFGGIKPNPLSGKVYEGIELGRKEKIDFILAIGGGSVIDSAKSIAAGIPYDGDFWDFYEGKAVEEAIKVGVILTIAASGSEGSPDAVLTRECDLKKTACGGEVLRPKFSIMNPILTTTLPNYQTMSGIVDIISHVLERYFTKTKNVEMTDCLCEAIIRGMVTSAKQLIDNPMDYDARANVMWGGYVAHNDICGVGRVQDWGTHHLEHELSALFGCTHGAGLAVLIPHWMEAAVDEDVSRFARIAVNVWGCKLNESDLKQTAMEGINMFRKFFKELDLPTSLTELEIKESDIDKIVDSLFHTSPTHGRFMDITREKARKIYEAAL